MDSSVLKKNMDHKCDHEENRMKVCAPCGRKIIFGGKRSQDFLISKSHEELIRKYINTNFDTSDSKFPLSICSTCRRALADREKNICKRPLQTMPKYEEIILPIQTRTTSECNCCYVCRVARFKGHSKQIKGRGHVLNVSNQIALSHDLNGTKCILVDKSEPSKNESRGSFEMCKKCFQQVGKGIFHPCASTSTSDSNVRDNVLKIVESLPEKQQNQIAASILKRKRSSGEQQSEEITLNTLGSKVRIALNPKPNKQVVFDAKKLDDFHVNSGVSCNHMKKMTSFLRNSAGRKSVPVSYEQNISQKLRTLEDVYMDDVFQFDTGNDQKENRPVIWADAEELLDAVVEKRGQIGIPKIKLMADGGQGFFKISLTILTEDYSAITESLGGSTRKKAKLTSVQKLILLCVVPEIKETYENLNLLVKLTKLNNIPFKFVSDFKVLLLANGQQTASATYPCPYCFVTLKELRHPQDTLNENSEDIYDESAKLKTYGDLKRDYNQFESLHKDKLKAKECHSTVNPPLFEENDDLYVIKKCVIPELHILQGFVNHLFWDGLVPMLTENIALLWPKKLHLISKNYQGRVFEGNACRRLLKEADKLHDPDICGKVGEKALHPYISAFNAMNKVVDSCFSNENFDNDLDQNLLELSEAFKSTGVSKTLKIHVLLDHLKQCLEFLDNDDGLGLWSEQAGESVHSKFLKVWERFKMNSIEDPNYIKRLKKAVVAFSSGNI